MGSPEVSVDAMTNGSCFLAACGGSPSPGGAAGLEIELEPLGPPPDMILAIPPPPLPGFMEGALGRIGSLLANGSCDLCDWAAGSGVGYVELPRKGMVIDDTWFLVILSSCLGITLLGIVLALFILKFRQQRLKAGLGTEVPAKAEKAKGKEASGAGDRCETVLYPTLPLSSSVGGGCGIVQGMAPGLPPSLAPLPLPLPPRPSRALWAGIRTSPPNHYTIAHLQPVAQRNKTDSEEEEVAEDDALADYAYADYGSVGYTCLSAPNSIIAPPPMMPSGLHFLGDGHAYYSAEPPEPTTMAVAQASDPMEGGGGSFENSGYVDSDDSCVESSGATAAEATRSTPGSRLQMSTSGLISPTGESFPLRAVGRSSLGRTSSTSSWSPRLSLDRPHHHHRHHHHVHHPHHHHTHHHRTRQIQVSSPTQIEHPNLPPLNLQRRGYSSQSLGKRSNNRSPRQQRVPTAVVMGKDSSSAATTIVGRRPPSPLAPGMERSSSFVAISSPIV